MGSNQSVEDTTTNNNYQDNIDNNYNHNNNSLNNLNNNNTNIKKMNQSKTTHNLSSLIKSSSSSSLTSSNPDDTFGWFHFNDDIDTLASPTNTLYQAPSLTDIPFYILHSSLDTQKLWYLTAGLRPKQPDYERKEYEKIYLQNFLNSSVNYSNDKLLTEYLKEAKEDLYIRNQDNDTSPMSTITTDSDSSLSNLSDNDNNNNNNINNINNINKIRNHNHNNNNHYNFMTDKNFSYKTSEISSKILAESELNIPEQEINGKLLACYDSNFSNSVTKSFYSHNIYMMTLQIPSYRIIQSNNSSTPHVEYLLIISLSGKINMTTSLDEQNDKDNQDNNNKNLSSSNHNKQQQQQPYLYEKKEFLYNNNRYQFLKFGIWKRYTDFLNLKYFLNDYNEKLYNKIYKNSFYSWESIKKRKKYYRCLDENYLKLKCFLLERFMQDVLFESTTPIIISKFLGIDFYYNN